VTPADWERLLERVSLPGFSPPVRLEYAGSAAGPTVVISRDLVDVETGLPKTFRTVEILPCWIRRDDREALRLLVHLVSVALVHEVEELIQVDGRKVFYPHGRGA